MLLVRKPSLTNGNLGDEALINALKLELQRIGQDFFILTNGNSSDISLSKYSALIYFGNDCIAYYNINKKLINKFLRANKKVFIINTSYGSNPSNNFLETISLNPNLHLFVRDELSLQLVLSRCKFHNEPKLVADLVFSLPFGDVVASSGSSLNKFIRWRNANDKPLIAINAHIDFNLGYEPVFQAFSNTLENLKHKYLFIFIVHDRRKKSEIQINSELYLKFKNNSFYLGYSSVEEELGVLNYVDFVITSRMHLGILSLLARKPPIIIEYNGVKALGTLSHWDLDILAATSLNTLPLKVSEVIDNYDDFRSIIDAKYDLVSKKSLVTFDIIKQELLLDNLQKKTKSNAKRRTISLLKDLLFKVYNRIPFAYDHHRFNKYCGWITSERYNEMSHSTLVSSLTIDYHRIEKGLSLAQPISNFGIKSGVFRRLYSLFNVYIQKYGHLSSDLFCAYTAVKSYVSWHQDNNLTLDNDLPNKICEQFSIVGNLCRFKDMQGGSERLSILDSTRNLIKDPQLINDFFLTRRSLRNFSQQKIKTSLINKIVDSAVQGTPTPCNRSTSKIYIIENQNLKSQLLSLQNGNKGFGSSSPHLAVITSNLQVCQDMESETALIYLEV